MPASPFPNLDPAEALKKMRAAIALGAESMTYAGKTYRFRSLDELRQIADDLERQVAGSNLPRRHVRVTPYQRHW